MTKTLLISWHYPWPKTLGGSLRTFNFYRFFRNIGTVDLVYSMWPQNAEKHDCLFRNQYFIEREKYPQTIFERLNRMTRGIPYPLSAYPEAEQNKLNAFIKRENYDFIVARYIRSVPGLEKIPKKYMQRSIIDFDDMFSGSLYETFFSEKKGLARHLYRYLNHTLIKNYEKRCQKFGACLFCSENDKKSFSGDNQFDNLHVVPNIFHDTTFDEFEFGDGTANENNLLFIGSLSYSANIEGLKWFIQNIYPEVKNHFSDMKLSVVGHQPTKEVRSICRETNGVELFPDVPDVKEYYKKSFAVIVPILSGGGTRIKILEAALAERPILSTPKGAEGLSLCDKNEIFLFNNAQEFCVNFASILSQNIYRSVCRKAKNKVRMTYSWENFRRSMNMVINSINGN